jgi:hypothetical protein
VENLVYGAIENLKTNQEINWDGDKPEKVLQDLQSLEGLDYDVHWRYAGDCGLEESEIYVVTPALPSQFSKRHVSGVNALVELTSFLERNVQIESMKDCLEAYMLCERPESGPQLDSIEFESLDTLIKMIIKARFGDSVSHCLIVFDQTEVENVT